MAASSHALGLATPSLTKWTLTSGSSTSSCCSATCIPAGHSPAALRLACSSSGGVRPLNLQARHATAVDGEVSTQQSSGSLVALEEELRTEVAVEVEGESSPEPSQQQQQPRQQRSNNVRRGKRGGAATTKPEELVEGAVFPGTVRTVTNYGAFVDIGAFTDGLVHISQLSDSYVAQVQDLVSVGQQVSVRILEADLTSGRISLSMRPAASSAPEAEAAPAPSGSGTARTPGERRKIAGRGASKPGGSAASSKPSVTKGQTVTGVVKNVTRTGIFLTLSTGDEGFLRVADISIDNPTNLALESLVQVGQELEVRVQRIDARGKVSLTQKREVDIKRLNASINNNEEAGAVNPFELVFRQSNLLNVNGDGAVANEEAEVVVEPVSVPEAAIEETVAEDTVEKEEVLAVVEDHAEEKIPEPAVAAPEAAKEKEVVAEETSAPEAATEEVVVEEPALPVAEAVAEAETSDEVAAPEGHLHAEEASQVGEEAAVSEEAAEVGAVAEAEPTEVVAAVEETSPVPDVEAEKVVDEPAASVAEPEAAVEEVGGEEPVAEAEPTEVVAAVEETSPVPDVEAEKVVDEPAAAVAEPETAVEEVGGEEPVAEAEPTEVVAAVEVTSPVPDVEAEKVVDEPAASVAEPEAAVEEVGGEEPVAEAEPTVVVAENVEPVVAESDAAAPAEEPSSPVAVVEPPALEPVSSSVSPSITAAAAAVIVSPALVKELRQVSGAGMMECKKALVACSNDLEKAADYLRKKGLASADKKASRVAAEGAIGSYIHDGRIGVLIEVNSETDFVARGDRFKELVQDLAMQVAAYPQVEYVSVEDIPAEIGEAERKIESAKDDLANKPEAVRSKIVDGRVNKILKELSLLDQPYIRNDKVLVQDHIKETIAALGENLQVRRFKRFNLGEGIEKKKTDFAAEVAEQTKPKEPKAEAPQKAPESQQDEAAPAVVVSAAAVKELRQGTGAGMMECKKALAACGNDLEKATEYLRKKGLASAEKKASRVAAEGVIGKYIHDGRIGVLIEVNCETDFVARGERFKELVQDLAMQVVACPQVTVVSVDDVPAEVAEKERELESQRDDVLSKPEAVRSRIVDGRIAKRLAELALLEQPYIRNDKVLVKDHVKETIAALGENIQVRRFVKFVLGEGIEKKKVDFAAEVAAQTKGLQP